jgi:hypothetical protein
MADAIPGYSRDQLLADLEPLIASKKFYTTQELAERYEVTIQTIKNWTKDKKLVPTLKVGDGCVRYSAADLAEFEKKFPG